MIPDGPYMDMHTHILPGIDDGSQTMDETVSMLRQAYEEGIRVIMATPHFGIRNPSLTTERAMEALELTKRAAAENVPGLRLLLGSELFYSDGIADALARGEAPTLGGTSYALVEFSTSDSRDRIYRCIRELSWNGFRPVIAHLERYRSLEGDIGAVEDLVDQGALVQINCRSFMGEPAASKPRRGLFSKKKQEGFFLERKAHWARQLLSEGLVHFIASDCHDNGFRTPVYRSALEAMEDYCSYETLKKIARDNPISLLKNERITQE